MKNCFRCLIIFINLFAFSGNVFAKDNSLSVSFVVSDNAKKIIKEIDPNLEYEIFINNLSVIRSTVLDNIAKFVASGILKPGNLQFVLPEDKFNTFFSHDMIFSHEVNAFKISIYGKGDPELNDAPNALLKIAIYMFKDSEFKDKTGQSLEEYVYSEN